MSKPELPPLPVTWTVPLAPPHEKAMWVSDAETWGLACYRAGLLRAAEICSNRAIKSAEFHADTEQDEIHNKATAWTLQVCAGDIRAEADKVA